MRIGQKVLFWLAESESGDATDFYGVEPQNSWYVFHYYPSEVMGIIVWNRGLLLAQEYIPATQTTTGCERRGRCYDISRKGVSDRISDIRATLEHHGMPETEFLEEVGDGKVKKLEDIFYNITLLEEQV